MERATLNLFSPPRLELPSKKSIGVKAKQTKLVEEVLRRKLAEPGGPGGFQDYVAARKQAVTEPELR